jgi:lysyl-tRNA synthetase class 1
LLTYLAKVAPKGFEDQFITEKLQSYSYLQENQKPDADLRMRVEYAFNWIKDFEEIKETAVSLSSEERSALADLIEVLKVEDEPEKIQNHIFNVAKKHNLQPGNFFKTLYTILLGVPQGPRLGPYLLTMGKQNVINALERVLKQD